MALVRTLGFCAVILQVGMPRIALSTFTYHAHLCVLGSAFHGPKKVQPHILIHMLSAYLPATTAALGSCMEARGLQSCNI